LDYTDVALEITPGGPITACQGDTIVLTAVNNVNNQNLVWTGFPAPTQPNNPVQVITNLPNINFAFLTATVEVGGCVVSDFVDLTFNAFDLPEIIDDITVCENTSVDLGSDVESFTTTYQWTPNLNLSPGPNVSGPVATPDVTTTYTLIANGSNGACLDTFQVTITVLPVVQIAPDTVFICLGDTATLNATNAAIPFTWGPQLFLNQINQNQVKVFPPVSTWYYTDVNATNCRDSVLVYVDSLPNLSIMAVPAKDSYCQGEEVTLISETYEPANFPGIEFMWEEPLFGSLTPDSFLNLVFQAVQTSTYVRTTTVNACTSVDSIQIEVVPVAMIEVNPPVSEICQGESVILQVSGDPGITEYTWTPAQGLNCTDCVSPTASPQVSTTYMVEAEFDGCPVGASATVNVSTGPGLLFPSQTTICLGQSIVLNNATDPNSTYVWTASDGSLNTTDPQPSVSPTQTTTYTVTATRGGCTITKEITIFIAEDFTISISPVGVLCGGDSVNLSVNAEGVSEASFQWTDEAGNPLGTGQTQGTGPLTETATFFVTVTDGGGCYSHTDSVTVEVSPVFTLTVDSPVEALQGEEVTLLANISPSGLNLDFTWTDNQGMVIGTDPSVIVSSCNTTIYSVLVSDDNGCSQTASVTLNVFEGFSIDTLTYENVTLDSSGVYEGQEVVLIAITTPPNLTGATYNWFINNELVSTTNAPMSETVNAPEVDENTLFDISVLITSQAGCQISKLDTMTVLNNPVQVPNAFSPNGDGDNDVFKPVSKAPITILKFQVWNRWGQLVFDNGNGAGGWDGKQDGEDVLSDVYIYFIQYEITGGNRGAQKPLKGDVTLLR
jgi:gliding motility-associated-like protein